MLLGPTTTYCKATISQYYTVLLLARPTTPTTTTTSLLVARGTPSVTSTGSGGVTAERTARPTTGARQCTFQSRLCVPIAARPRRDKDRVRRTSDASFARESVQHRFGDS